MKNLSFFLESQKGILSEKTIDLIEKNVDAGVKAGMAIVRFLKLTESPNKLIVLF